MADNVNAIGGIAMNDSSAMMQLYARQLAQQANTSQNYNPLLYNCNFQSLPATLPMDTTTLPLDTTSTSPTINYVPEVAKSTANGGKIAGVVASGAALILTGVAAHKGGGIFSKNVIKNIGTGYKKMYNGAVNFIKGTKNKLFEGKQVFSMEKSGSQNVCEIPHRINREGFRDVNNAAADLGITTHINELPKGATLKSATIKKGNYVIEFHNGHPAKITKNNKDVLAKYRHPADANAEKLKAEVDDIITQVVTGKNGTDITLANAKYRVTENGITKLFSQASSGGYDLEKFVTRKFNADSLTAKGYLKTNEAAKKAYESFVKGETKNLKILSGEYNASGVGTFKMKNNEIDGIKVGDEFYKKGSYEYIALEEQHPEVFKSVAEKADTIRFINPIYGV